MRVIDVVRRCFKIMNVAGVAREGTCVGFGSMMNGCNDTHLTTVEVDDI